MDGQGKTCWECGICGQQHDGLAMVFGAQAPDPWLQATPAEREGGELNADMCVLNVEGELGYVLNDLDSSSRAHQGTGSGSVHPAGPGCRPPLGQGAGNRDCGSSARGN